MPYLIFILIFLLQALPQKVMAQENKKIGGLILDAKRQTPLPYTNIIVLHKNLGTISNEKGYFSLDIDNVNSTDSLSFQYIGYKTLNICITDIDSNTTIHLQEEIINLNETFIFSNPPNAKTIVKKILDNKSKNYKKVTQKNQIFIRRRNSADINRIKIIYKKNDIPELNEKIIHNIEQNMPKHNISYTDFLGEIYTSASIKDSIKLKPIKIVSLKSKDVSELEQTFKIFDKLFTDTKAKEYWKVKSGIFSQKLDISTDEDDSKKDSVKEKNSYRTETNYLNRSVKNQYSYGDLEDTDDWDFLYHTGNYKYILAGGTRINGEDAYIIDFTPKNSGKFIGRIYVSIESYALIRADYKYDINKTGTDISLFGVGYTSNYFEGSIFFEKKDNNYVLKYLSKKTGNIVHLDRNISLIKKRERFLFDKELRELKVKFHYTVSSINSSEILVLNQNKITELQFKQIKQAKMSKIILVNQFNSEIWKGYPIIEPTQSMKEYKKID